jgi:hypothetical protein
VQIMALIMMRAEVMAMAVIESEPNNSIKPT